MIRRSFLALTLASSLALGACSMWHPPVTIQSNVPAGMSETQLKVIIESSAISKGWKIQSAASGKYVLEYVLHGQYRVLANLTYSTQSYQLAVDPKSQLREERDGEVKVHRRINHWLHVLDAEIQNGCIRWSTERRLAK